MDHEKEKILVADEYAVDYELENPRILTQQSLLQTACKYELFGEERIIDMHIKNLWISEYASVYE